MGFLQAVLGGVFTILATASVFFIAYKAMSIGNDVAEMKELLKQLQRGGAPAGSSSMASNAYVPRPLDTYEEPTPMEPPPPPKPERVLPPPISRRLDAERGLRRDADEGSRVRF